MSLAVEPAPEAKFGLCAAVPLALVKFFLRDLIFEDFGWFLLLENLVLPEGEKALKGIVTKGEADDQALPGEARTVKEGCKALKVVVRWRGTGRSGWELTCGKLDSSDKREAMTVV